MLVHILRYLSDDSSEEYLPDELENGAHNPTELESNLSDGKTKQPLAKRRKHAIALL